MQIDSPARKRNLISLTPLIDIVFILLVFFMLASTFSQWSFLGIAIGEGETTEIGDPSHTLVGIKPSDTAMPRLAVEERFLTMLELQAEIKAAIANDPKHSVLLLPAPTLPLQQMVMVLETLQRDFGERVSLAVAPPEAQEAP